MTTKGRADEAMDITTPRGSENSDEQIFSLLLARLANALHAIAVVISHPDSDSHGIQAMDCEGAATLGWLLGAFIIQAH